LGGLLNLHLGINGVSKLQFKPSFDVKSNKKTKHFFNIEAFLKKDPYKKIIDLFEFVK